MTGGRITWSWGSVLMAALAFGLSCIALLSNDHGRVLFAGMMLSAVAGFLIVRLIVERSKISSAGGRIAIGTLSCIVPVLVVVVSSGPGTVVLLAMVTFAAGAMAASTTWFWRFSPRWLRLTPADETGSSVDKLLEGREATRALSDLDRAQRLDPENEHHYRYLKHLVHLSNNDFPRALVDIQSAIEANAGERDDYYEAAVQVYVRMDRIDAAIALLDKRKRSRPGAESLHRRAFSTALAYLDVALASEIAAQSEKFWNGDRSREYSLQRTRADVLAQLQSRGG